MSRSLSLRQNRSLAVRQNKSIVDKLAYFWELIQDQPDVQWRTGTMYDPETETYCPLGWALQKAGCSKFSLITLGFGYYVVAEHLGIPWHITHKLGYANDTSDSRRDALEKIRQVIDHYMEGME